ncbi:MAG: flavodoxin family protein [Eubacterium sp.]|nr:flavodoxin family protein [Eubacterium sp.]
MKKTLIINGSPRKKGDTATLIAELKKHLTGEVVEISAYRSNIRPCVDCRQCQKTNMCVVRDDMDLIYADDFDAVVMAYPVYYATAPGPIWSLLSRFQCYHEYLKTSKFPPVREKKAGLILVAGGSGNEMKATPAAYISCKMMNAHGLDEHMVISSKTDEVPAREDQETLAQLKELAAWLES